MSMADKAAVTALLSTLELVQMRADDAHERAIRNEGTHSEVQTAADVCKAVEAALDTVSPCTCGGAS